MNGLRLVIELQEQTRFWKTSPSNLYEEEVLEPILDILRPMIDRAGTMLLSEYDPLDYAELAPVLCWIDTEHNPDRYRFRLIGTRIIESYGIDNTGIYLDTLKDELGESYEEVRAAFEWTAKQKCLLRQSNTFEWVNRKHIRLESLQFPLLGDDGKTKSIVSYTVFANPQTEY